jgi:dephospho-CoA kinase
MTITLNPRFCERFAIGLTGGIASGKSTASERFAQLGAAVVDTDVVAHQLTQASGEAMPAIEAAFGAALIQADGSMNRAAMRALVFAQPEQRARLEAILHPLIHSRTRTLGASTAGNYVVFVVPLLVESPRWPEQVDCIVVVDCEPAVQLSRLLQRPGMTPTQAQQMIAAQANRAQRLAAAQVLVHNHGDKAALLAQIDVLHRRFSEQAHTHGRAASAKLRE